MKSQMTQACNHGRNLPTRSALALCAAGIFCLVLLPSAFAQPRFGRGGFYAPPRMQQPRPPRMSRQAGARADQPGNSRTPNGGNAPRTAVAPRQEQHLQDWINAHQNLTVDQRVEALQREPGFSQLPPNTQLRMIQRMRELSAMTPEQQQVRTTNIEAMEHMNPQQRGQMVGALRAISNMPEDRQRLVRKAFRDMREVPVEQRNAIIKSDRFRSQFTDHERTVLGSLLAVEPYMPPARPTDDTQFGK